MSSIGSYRDLKIWQEAMLLVEQAYRLTPRLPKDEIYGLSAQIKRAAVSIPANIAEGYGRGVTGSYLQFLRIARDRFENWKRTFYSRAVWASLPTARSTRFYPDVTRWAGWFTV